MTADEQLLCRSFNRDLFEAWTSGRITYGEAAFIAHRDQYLLRCLRFGMPRCLLSVAGWTYDALFESVSLSTTVR